jgi:L-asparagine transporter-like permease
MIKKILKLIDITGIIATIFCVLVLWNFYKKSEPLSIGFPIWITVLAAYYVIRTCIDLGDD